MTASLAALLSVAFVSTSGLLGLRMWLRHREKKLEHEPLVELQRRLERIERLANVAEIAKLSRRA